MIGPFYGKEKPPGAKKPCYFIEEDIVVRYLCAVDGFRVLRFMIEETWY